MAFSRISVIRYLHSLTFKLILISVLLVSVGGWIRFQVVQQILTSGIEELVNNQQVSLATYVAEDIGSKVNERRQLLVKLAGEIPHHLSNKAGSLNAWLEGQWIIKPLFSEGVVVIPANGHGAVADFPNLLGRLDLDFNDRDWFQAVRKGADFAIGKPGTGRAAKKAVINMAVPILDTNKVFIGVLMGVTAVDDPGFLNLVQKSMVGKTGGLLLISPKDKIFVTASDPEMRLTPTPPQGVNPLHDKGMAGWRGSGVTINAKGVQELAALVSVPGTDWFLVARTPFSEAFKTVDRLIAAVIERSITYGLALIVFLGILLTYATRPLKDSAQKMRAMAAGDLPLTPLPVVRRDEVGTMVEGFNELVDKLQRSQAQMQYLAHHDALTGLPNRMSFQASLMQSVALANRQKNSLSLLFLDLDGFKSVNDTFGHDCGDALLKQVADRLQDCIRASDIAGRLGGDEFIVLLTDDPSEADVAQVAQKIITQLGEPYQVGNFSPAISTSIGAAMYPVDAPNADHLLAVADTAMYTAKRAGGGRFVMAQR